MVAVLSVIRQEIQWRVVSNRSYQDYGYEHDPGLEPWMVFVIVFCVLFGAYFCWFECLTSPTIAL